MITKKKILYIGGDTACIEQLHQIDTFSIEIVTNSLEAIKSITTSGDYDAVFCEMYIPGVNAIEFYRLLTEQTRITTKIPYVIIHHAYNKEVILKAFNAGIDDVWITPLVDEKVIKRTNFLFNYKLRKKDSSAQEYQPIYKVPVIKRLFDIVVASVALLLFSPLLLITALAIRLESKGKVYYISKRVGTGYKVFNFYKLRSMYTGADARLKDLKHLNQYEDEKSVEKTIIPSCPECEKLEKPCSPILYIEGEQICERQYKKIKTHNHGTAFIKIKDDPRVTKVGSFIRKTSIDELPQLINVIKGNMSIVGNRPLPLYEAEQLTSDNWTERFLGPAGITGLWQVSKRGKSEMSEEERKNLDNVYARDNSFVKDIIIILQTIPALFQKENV